MTESPAETVSPEPASNASGQVSSALGNRLIHDWRIQLLEIVFVFMPVLLVIIAFRMLNLENPMLFIAGIWVANILMLGIVALGIRFRGETGNAIGLGWKPVTLSRFAITILKSLSIFLIAVVAFAIGAIVMALLVGIPEAADMSRYNYMRGNLPLLLISLAGVYIVSSFGEEVVYRGFLITRLQQLFGGESKTALLGSLVLSSLVFGLAHFTWGLTGIVQTTFMGVALGASFLLSGRSLWPLVMAHGYLDTLLLVQLYLAPAVAD